MAAQPLQSVSISRYELRSSSGSVLPPDSAGGSSSSSSYHVFAVVVKLAVKSWTVYRRYSEFVRLDKCLASSSGVGEEPSGAGKPAPRALPPKARAREWKKTWSTFSSLPTSFFSSQPSAAQQQELEEQRAFLRERQTELDLYLKAIVLHSDPCWRESEAFKTFIEWPLSIKMTTATAASTSPRKARPDPPPTPQQQQAVSLLSTQPPARTLGQTRRVVEETANTRALDNAALYESQNMAMDQQDQQLDNLTAILRRQRLMGETINQELGEQTDLLTQLDAEVTDTQANLARADAKMDRFDNGKAKNKMGIGRKF